MTISKRKIIATVAAISMAFGAFSAAESANAATPVELVFGPQVGTADDGSFYVIDGEWSGEVTELVTTWFSCPTLQFGAVGDVADLTQQIADAGCVAISSEATVPADTFDFDKSYPLLLQVADGAAAVYQGTAVIMYDRGGPIAYNERGVAGKLSRTLHFNGNSATLTAKSRSGLFALISKMGKASHIVLTVDAYAAKGGNAAKNTALARGRARQIMFFFKRKGVNATFKIRTHVSAATGAAGRKATVKVSFVPGNTIV